MLCASITLTAMVLIKVDLPEALEPVIMQLCITCYTLCSYTFSGTGKYKYDTIKMKVLSDNRGDHR